MDLTTYIEKTGDKAFASLIGCSVRAAQAWRLGERVPSRLWAEKIVSTVKGINFDDIYAGRGRGRS